jgi:hypothetical protein
MKPDQKKDEGIARFGLCTNKYFRYSDPAFFWQNQRKAGDLSLDDTLFNVILLVLVVEQLMDIGQWVLDAAGFAGVYEWQMVCYTGGYAIAPLITCLWVMYCDLRVYMDERALKRRLPLYLIPLI